VISHRWSERNTGYFEDTCDTCLDREIVRITLDIRQHLAGPTVPRTVVAVWAVHGGGCHCVSREERLFVLSPITDEKVRAKLRAEYYIRAMPLVRAMYCLSGQPEAGALPPDVAIFSNDQGYCFEPSRVAD
jgi:hypothetical protein